MKTFVSSLSRSHIRKQDRMVFAKYSTVQDTTCRHAQALVGEAEAM